jgi:Protein kinase domain
MRQMLVCPHGHRWDPASAPTGELDGANHRCPTCGDEAELFSLRDTTTQDSSQPGEPRRQVMPPSGRDPQVAGFELLGQIGRGGMGTVYKARQLDGQRLVALKMISSGAQASPSEMARFRQEIQAVCRLKHPHIVPVYATGEQEGLPYFALEFMDRGTLADVITDNPMPGRLAAELVEKLARAVDAAHSHGIVHRDLKPANVLLVTPPTGAMASQLDQMIGVPKIADFGLAKFVDQDGGQTKTGAVMGTPSYMAPEQAEGKTKEIGPAVDVYALGALLYEALTGQPPFKGATPIETLDQVRSQEPVPPRRRRPEVPRDLETICLKALEKQPAGRYGSAGAMADDLKAYLSGSMIRARSVSSLDRAARWVRKRKLPVALAGLAAAIAVVGLAVGAVLWNRADRVARESREREQQQQLAAADAKQLKAEYYVTFVKRWGLPEGVGPLTEEQARRRDSTYKIYRRDGKVEAMEAVNHLGRLTNRHGYDAYLESRGLLGMVQQILRGGPGGPGQFGAARHDECRWEYQRNEKGELVREVALDKAGGVAWAFTFTNPTTGFFTDERGFPRPRAGSGAAYVSFDYDANGFVVGAHYLDRAGKRRPDTDGVYGQKIERDERGLAKSVNYLGSKNQPVQPFGYARKENRYDDRGLLTEIAFFDVYGRPTLGDVAGARQTTTYDANGNPVEFRSFGRDGQPMTGMTSFVRMTYDQNGRQTAVESAIAGGGPQVNTRPIRSEFRYDDHGRLIEQESITSRMPNGKTAPRTVAKLAYDDQDRIIEASGPTAVVRGLVALGGGLASTATRKVRYQYDEHGRLIEEAYVNERGDPIESAGIHRTTTKYNARGQRTEFSSYDLNGKLAGRRITRPSFGKAKEKGEAPPATVLGPARYRWTWDEQGNNIEVAAFGPDDKLLDRDVTTPIGGPANIVRANVNELTIIRGARVTGKYDDRGNQTEIAYFGASGRLAPTPQRNRQDESGSLDLSANFFWGTFSRLKRSFDEQGNLTEIAYFDENDQPMSVSGEARSTARYDEDGHRLESTSFDQAGKSKVDPFGVAKYKHTYDDFGDRTSIECFGPDDRPCMNRFGYSRAEFTFDSAGAMTGSRYLDTEGRPLKTRVVVRTVLNTRDFGGGVDGAAVPRQQPSIFEKDDVIVSYAGQPVESVERLISLKQLEDSNREQKSIEVQRGDQIVTLSIPSGPMFNSLNPLNSRGFFGRISGSVIFSPLRAADFSAQLERAFLETEAVPAGKPLAPQP